MNIVGTISTGSDIGGTPSGIASPVVLIPSNCVVQNRSRDNIEITIAIHIRDMNIVGTISTGSDIGCGPRRIGFPVIFIPSDGVVISRSRDNI